jgi:hypothetical protein
MGTGSDYVAGGRDASGNTIAHDHHADILVCRL